MARILAIDFGRKRCGIAVTDSLQLAGNALATVRTCELIDYVKGYMSHEDVCLILVGWPTDMHGQPSESTRWLVPAIERLRKEVAPVTVEYYDERFTSVLAHRAMIEGGMKKSDRRDKSVVDRVSAAIILNDYLTSRSPGSALH